MYLCFLLLSVSGKWWCVPFCFLHAFPRLASFLLFLHQLREPNRIPHLKDTVLVATETLLISSASNLVQRLLEGLLAHYFSKHRQDQCKTDNTIHCKYFCAVFFWILHVQAWFCGAEHSVVPAACQLPARVALVSTGTQ